MARVYTTSQKACDAEYRKSKPWGELSSELTQLKKTEKWLYDFDSQMTEQVPAKLKRSYIHFFERRAAFPKFQKKRHSGQSFPQRVRAENERVYVPTLGWIRIRQSQTKDSPTKGATFERTATGKWFVTLVTEVEMPDAKVPAERFDHDQACRSR